MKLWFLDRITLFFTLFNSALTKTNLSKSRYNVSQFTSSCRCQQNISQYYVYWQNNIVRLLSTIITFSIFDQTEWEGLQRIPLILLTPTSNKCMSNHIIAIKLTFKLHFPHTRVLEIFSYISLQIELKLIYHNLLDCPM